MQQPVDKIGNQMNGMAHQWNIGQVLSANYEYVFNGWRKPSDNVSQVWYKYVQNHSHATEMP